MFCSSCGSQATGRFCSHCGKWMRDFIPPKKQFWSLLWKTLLFLAVITGAFFYIHYAFQQSLTSTVEDHFGAIRERKITEAYYNFASKELQKVISFDHFKTLVDHTNALSLNHEVIIKETNLEYPYGTVAFVLVSEEGEETPGTYQLYRDGGKWKIYSIELTLPDYEITPPQEEIALNEERTTVAPQKKGATAIMEPVAEQLEALKVGNKDRAFRLFSQEYIKEHSIEDFKQFLILYPILTNYKSASFENIIDNGTTGSITVILDPKAGDIPVEYYLVKENDEWKVSNMQISLPVDSQQDPKELIPIVEKFVGRFKSGNVGEAYSEGTSKKFKEITSYETFAEFLRRFPIVTTSSKIEYTEPKIEKGTGTVLVTFLNDQQKMVLLVTLGVEDHAWKVWGIRIVSSGEPGSEPAQTKAPAPVSAPEKNLLEESKPSTPKVQTLKESHDIGKRAFSSDDLDAVIKRQLEDLKANDLHKAYDNYSSKEFKETTPFEAFNEFIKSHPIFQKYRHINFDKLVFNNNIPTFGGVLMAENGDEYKVEYDFIKEDDVWKVLHIEITPREATEVRKGGVSEKSSKGLFEFSRAVLGSKVDSTGIVEDAKSIFKSDAGGIFVNLYILNGVKGTKVEMTLKHLESGSNAPPISTTLQDDGNSVISYHFTNPSRGWPVGRYTLYVTSSTGQNAEYNLRVE